MQSKNKTKKNKITHSHCTLTKHQCETFGVHLQLAHLISNFFLHSTSNTLMYGI